MESLSQCLSNAMNILAAADECVQPFSPQARLLDEAVKILESIDYQDDHNVVYP